MIECQSQSGDLRELAGDVRRLSRLRISRSLLALAFDWLAIAAAFALALHIPHALTWLLAGCLVATRQHALLILMHDAAHYRLLPARAWNDRLSDWLVAYPLLLTTEAYRRHHLAHHQHLNSELDPDWVRKSGPAWEFPKSMPALLGLCLRDLLGGGVLDNLKMIGRAQRLDRQGTQIRSLDRPLFYAFVLALCWLGDLWLAVALLWFLPAFTVLPVLMRLRSIAEHSAVAGDLELNSSRTTRGALWERLLLVPHNAGYHLDHHLFPSVPFYHLPELHSLLLDTPEYREHAHLNDGYLGGPGTLLAELRSRPLH